MSIILKVSFTSTAIFFLYCKKKVDQVINLLVWSSLRCFQFSICVTMIKSPETHDPFLKKIDLENNVQSMAHLKNIALKTHFFYFTNCSSSFLFKIRRRGCITSSCIDSGTSFNFPLDAQVICHLLNKCLLSPKIAVSAFHPVLSS